MRRGAIVLALAAYLVLPALTGATSATAKVHSTPGFTTSLTNGMTLTTPYTWTFNPGSPTVAGYFWADGTLLAKITGPGPYTLVVQSSMLAGGPHKLGHAWETTTGQHQTPPTNYTVTVVHSSPPVNTAAPTITGSAAVGDTLIISAGQWSNTPTSYSYQWQRCSSSGTGCSSITAASDMSYTLQDADAGLTVRAEVIATNAAGSTSVLTAPSGRVSNSTETFDSATSYLNTAPPAPTVTATTAAQFSADVAVARAGTVIEVTSNVHITGEFTGFQRVISGGTADVIFEPGVTFTGVPGSELPAVWLRNSGGWRLWGGTITTGATGGSGILAYAMPGPFTWTGFTVENTGNTGVEVYPVDGNINALTLDGLVEDAGQDLNYDPHAEKGTGVHAWNIADANGGVVENSTFACDVLNQATGAAVEWDMGRTGPNNRLYVRADHLGVALPGTTWSGDAKSQVAGNVFQPWGASIPSGGSLDIKYLEGNNIQGRIVDSAGANSGANWSAASVDDGVASGAILQNSRLSKVAYEVGSTGLKLGTVSPTP